MTTSPRVALLCETFHEINGVALTARQLVAYAQRHGLPLLAVHGGKTPGTHDEGSVRRVELKRAWASIPIECDLKYDFFFWRYAGQLREELRRFRPDVIHITSPGELGQLGVYLSRELGIPLVASWHTNFHQFAARRLQKLIGFLPQSVSGPIVSWTQDRGLGVLLWFYEFAAATLAPTAPQVEWLEKKLRRPSFLMTRGVDSGLFHPKRRTANDGKLRLGFVGRVSPEKGLRLLRQIERTLESRGITDFEILVVGDGSEIQWLKKRLKHGVFTGVLRGEELAQAYANMDVFVFPSRTDTFGNVVQESAASQVPAVVTNEGGPRHLVVQGVTGYVAASNGEFVERVVELARDEELRRRMGVAARERVAGISWDAAFELTYAAYRHCQSAAPVLRTVPKKAVMLA
ncbi:MAG TPA: glycosyltransferase [Methylomirabilota bacterium]|nr:glycosyltransferase [Methylomirabilota bacterium]